MTSDVNSIWNTCSENGKRKPWFVISVIGDSKSIVPSTWEKSIFQNSLIDTAKCANECWIFHMGGKGKLSQTVQKAVENYNEINGLTGDTGEKQGVHYNMWRNAQKPNIELFKLQPTENAKKVLHSKSNKKDFTIPEENYIQIHTQLLKKIGEERVKIMRLNKDLSKFLNIFKNQK